MTLDKLKQELIHTYKSPLSPNQFMIEELKNVVRKFKEAEGTQYDAYHLVASMGNETEDEILSTFLLDIADDIQGWGNPSCTIWDNYLNPNNKAID